MPVTIWGFAGTRSDYFNPCIAMNAAHVRAEPAIITRSGMTVDLVDFSIASTPVDIREEEPRAV